MFFVKSFSLLLIFFSLNYLKYLLKSRHNMTRGGLLNRLSKGLGNSKKVVKFVLTSNVKRLSFLPKYYSRNELMWNDGFLVDFLQKKSVDMWIRKFVIYTGFLFSERLVFDSVVRLYLDNLLWPLHYVGLFESNNVVEVLSIIIFLYFFVVSVIFFFLLFI